jgi:hypothetical protein
MNSLSLNQTADISGGGCSTAANRVIATAGLVAGIASAFGPIGLAIAGPTALGMGIASVVCAYT